MDALARRSEKTDSTSSLKWARDNITDNSISRTPLSAFATTPVTDIENDPALSPRHFFGSLPVPSSLTLLSKVGSRLSIIISVPEYFIAAVGANVTPTSQLPALTPLDLGPRSSSSQVCVMLNGLVTPFSISIRIGSGTFFFLTLPALMTFTSLVLFDPTST